MGMTYACNFCGKMKVKLWKPLEEEAPLICATCAEERQKEMRYLKRVYEKIGDKHVMVGTAGKEWLPIWTVDEKGKVPSYNGPSPEGEPRIMVDNLLLGYNDEEGNYQSYSMFPAVLDEGGEFYQYHQIPEDSYQEWEELPTR